MGVGQRTPIGADHAVKTIFVSQHTADDTLVESETNRFVLGINGHAVIGHDHGGAGGDCGFKGQQVIIEVVAGINLLAPVFEVRIFAILLWAAAGKMFGHARNALRSQLASLEAADISLGQPRRQLIVFAKSTVDPCPAWFRCQIGHRVQRGAQTDGEVFLPGNIGELRYELFIADGGQARSFGPLRESLGRHMRARIHGKAVTRIR